MPQTRFYINCTFLFYLLSLLKNFNILKTVLYIEKFIISQWIILNKNIII